MNRKSGKTLQFKDFAIKHKNELVTGLLVFLLACVTIYVSYAYYRVTDDDPIISGEVGDIPDLEVRIMAQNRDNNGSATDGYSEYPYIPEAGYVYNSSKSYCANGASIDYHENTYDATIVAQKTDLCFLYFDAVDNLDITLNVYAENIDNEGNGTGDYTKLETTALPSIGYVFNKDMSECSNGSSITYNNEENMFTIEASQKDTCDAYMDAISVDILLRLHIQDKKGSGTFYDATNIPTNVYYDLAQNSSCTGTSSLSLENQKVKIAATGKTSCDAYLTVGEGPIIESVNSDVVGNKITLNFKASNLGSIIQSWHYAVNDGNYQSTTEDSVTLDLNPNTNYTISTYGVDASGKTSAIKTITQETDYYYEGNFSYSSSVQNLTIAETGYYKLEVWGAQGGTYSSYEGGKGGYSTGIVLLNSGTNLYIHTGGQPTQYNSSASSNNTNAGGANGGGAGRTYSYSGTTTYGLGGGGGTDIRIGTDDYYHRIIVAGGGSGATSRNAGYAGGGTNGAGYNSSYYGTQTSAGTGGGFGYGGASSGSYNYKYGSAGGGGGWYGGGAGTGSNDSDTNYASYMGGGSGFVFTASSSLPSGYGLDSSYYMTSASTTAGTSSFLDPNGTAETGHSGNGYARITYVGRSLGD